MMNKPWKFQFVQAKSFFKIIENIWKIRRLSACGGHVGYWNFTEMWWIECNIMMNKPWKFQVDQAKVFKIIEDTWKIRCKSAHGGHVGFWNFTRMWWIECNIMLNKPTKFQFDQAKSFQDDQGYLKKCT